MTPWMLFLAAALPQVSLGQTQWSVMNYYVFDNMPYSSVNGLWGGITHLAVGDFHVNSDASIRYAFDPGSMFPAAVSAAHANGAKALVVLSDIDSSDNLKAAFANNPSALMANIAKVVTTYGFDGIQVDWEVSFPYGSNGSVVNSQTQATLGSFFQSLRAQLGNNMLIMADAFPAGGPWGVVTHTEWNSAIPYMDRLAVMTYDIVRQVSGAYSWFNSPLYNGNTAQSQAGSIEQSIQLFVASGSAVPASKLMLGIPFYGYLYNGASSPRQNSGSVGGQSNYSNLSKSYNLSAATFDDAAQVPWLPVSNGYVTFDNPQSVAAKVNYARSKGLGGWLSFNLFADYLPASNPQHPLLAAINGVTSYAATPPSISTSSLPAGTAGSAYAATVTASGTAPLRWGVTGGSLPSGLSMDSSSGMISGTPSTPGTSPFTLTASNGAGSDSKAVTLTVNAVSPSSSGWFQFISKNSGKCLDVNGISSNPGASLIQWSCWGGDNQKFQLTPVSGGYKITAKNSSLQLDVAGGPGSTQNGVQIIQWPYWGGTNQIWTFRPNADGTYSISPVNSGKCMDVTGVSVSDNARIQQWQCTGGANQAWKLVPTQ